MRNRTLGEAENTVAVLYLRLPSDSGPPRVPQGADGSVPNATVLPRGGSVRSLRSCGSVCYCIRTTPTQTLTLTPTLTRLADERTF